MNENTTSEHPGLVLKERFLEPLEIRPSELAESIGVSTRRVTELLKGRRRLSPDMAHRLGLYFNVPPLWFLEMQARYDAELLRGNIGIRTKTLATDRQEGLLITPGGVIPVQKADSSRKVPSSVHVSDEFLARLKAQVAISGRKVARRPKVITLPDGTPVLTGE